MKELELLAPPASILFLVLVGEGDHGLHAIKLRCSDVAFQVVLIICSNIWTMKSQEAIKKENDSCEVKKWFIFIFIFLEAGLCGIHRGKYWQEFHIQCADLQNSITHCFCDYTKYFLFSQWQHLYCLKRVWCGELRIIFHIIPVLWSFLKPCVNGWQVWWVVWWLREESICCVSSGGFFSQVM